MGFSSVCSALYGRLCLCLCLRHRYFVFTPFYSVGDIGGNFWSLVICFVPRILIGVAAGVCFKRLSKVLDNAFTYIISGVLGSLVNTLLVLGGIYLFFGNEYSKTIQIGFELLLGIIGMTILTSGIPEAVIGGITAYAVGRPLRKINSKYYQ